MLTVQQLLRSFDRRGLLQGDHAHAMGAWAHGCGFSVNPAMRIEVADRPGATAGLLRPHAVAWERLQLRDGEHLIYASNPPGSGDCGPQLLTLLQLLDRFATLVPSPRGRWHRYHGVLAANSPLHSAVSALALPGAPPLNVRFARAGESTKALRENNLTDAVC